MHSRNVKFRKSFLYPIVACAMLMYIYLQVSSSLASRPTIVLYNGNEELATDSTTTTANRDVKRILHYKELIKEYNTRQIIQNDDINEKVIGLVIVIQVHDRVHYLRQLVNSLKNARGISKALIIFSHSCYNEDINRVIWTVSFARVMQIFYPYSVQLHPGVFPGNDQKTCNEVMACRKSNRPALLSQTKLHWWWKATFVFDTLSAIKRYNGSVLFIEENQYVTEDFIYIFKVLEELINASYPNCDIISLGSNEPNISSYLAENTSILLKPWNTIDNVGIAFNRHTWNTIKGLSNEFCSYNDNRWDKSLSFLASKTKLGKFDAVTIESPRIFRFTKCNNKTSCDEFEKVELVDTFVIKIKNGLFPYKLHIVKSENVEAIDQGNGGWADSRDHELCRYFTTKRQKSY